MNCIDRLTAILLLLQGGKRTAKEIAHRFKQERESLLAKVQTLLPRREREDLDQLTQTLSLDVPSRPYPTPFLDHLLESARVKQWVAVTYRSEKEISQQTLLPMHVRTEAGLWYCEAYSSERKATRVYRVDRFLEVKAASSPPQLESPASPIAHVHPSFPEVCLHLTARGVLRLEREPYLASRLQQKEQCSWQTIQFRILRFLQPTLAR